MTDRATLVLGPGAARLRRDLGPVAWSALEVTATQSVRDGDRTVARVGVRRLAQEMGVAKNTAARAARLLLDEGLLVRSQQRTATGRFERGRYELVLPLDALVVSHDDGPANPTADHVADVPKRARTSHPNRAITVEQLALLPQ